MEIIAADLEEVRLVFLFRGCFQIVFIGIVCGK